MITLLAFVLAWVLLSQISSPYPPYSTREHVCGSLGVISLIIAFLGWIKWGVWIVERVPLNPFWRWL